MPLKYPHCHSNSILEPQAYSYVRGTKAQNRIQPWEASAHLTERTSKMSAHSQTFRDFL